MLCISIFAWRNQLAIAPWARHLEVSQKSTNKSTASSSWQIFLTLVCTENLDPDVMVMKPAKDCA